ncbi:Zn-ribbon domain-containing OB-fold protein [Streptomyces sp. NPDC002680]|uniref:Zn-ribbon domain-containing OB-fold protein n=1 Tax=Streptomyces sp. NPDC002680 TaxID=3364659 RepID=UPI00368BC991
MAVIAACQRSQARMPIPGLRRPAHRAYVAAGRMEVTFMSDMEISIPLRMPLTANLAIDEACVPLSGGGLALDLDQQSSFGGLKDGELYFQRCKWCRTPAFRRVFCRACASEDLELERSEGTGVVARSVVVRRDDVPYVISTVAMAEGFRLQGSVVGAGRDVARPGSRVCVEAVADSDPWTVTFKPYGGPAARW